MMIFNTDRLTVAKGLKSAYLMVSSTLPEAGEEVVSADQVDGEVPGGGDDGSGGVAATVASALRGVQQGAVQYLQESQLGSGSFVTLSLFYFIFFVVSELL